MGQSNQKLPNMQKIDLEVQLSNIFERLQILRNRRINDLITQEIDIREKIRQNPDKYTFDNLKYDFIPIVNLYNQIEIIKIIMRYSYSLKNYTLRITSIQNSKHFDDLEQLQPYIEGIMWSGYKLNQSFIVNFSNMIQKYFGMKVYQKLTLYNKLDDHLKYGFLNIEPTDKEISQYIEKFTKRYKIQLKNLNKNDKQYTTNIPKNKTKYQTPVMNKNHTEINSLEKKDQSNKNFDDILDEFCNSETDLKQKPKKEELKKKLDHQSALYMKDLMKDKNQYNINLQSALSKTKFPQLYQILNQLNVEYKWKIKLVLKDYYGLMSLLCWNSVLNLTSFFMASISDNIYTYFGFGVAFGGLICFMIGPLLFSRFKNSTSIYFGIIGNLITFFLSLYICTVDISQHNKTFWGTLLITISGFFSSLTQAKGAAMASSNSSKEINLFNFGTGLCGMLTNIVSYSISHIIPLPKVDSYDTLKQQTLWYSIFVLIIGILIIVQTCFFERKFFKEMESQEEREIQDIFDEDNFVTDNPKSMSDIKIILRSFDLLVGIFFNFMMVLLVVAFCLIEAWKAYDLGDSSRELFDVPFYIFFYNVGDTIGKYFPPSTYLNNVKYLHFLALLTMLFYAYFLRMLRYEVSDFESNPYTRVVILFILGILNGYNINNFMHQGASRFRKKMEKGKVGYYSILFLLLGITFATCINNLYYN